VLARLAISEFRAGEREDGLKAVASLQPETLNQQLVLVLGVELAKGELCDKAIPYLLRARTASPASADLGYDLAVCYLSGKQYPEATSALQSLIDGGHETSEIDNTLAEAYEADHQTQKAVDALRRAIALSPGDDENYLDFASLCLDHQDFQNAAKVLAVGLDVHPKSSRLVFERGILNAMQDRFEDAEKDFQLSAGLAPESDTGYIGLGVTYLETGKAAQAVPVLRGRLRDHPEDANLSYLLAEALLRSGAQQGDAGYSEAQTLLEKSVRLNPNMVEPHVSLGTIYLRQDKARDAAEQFEQARKIDPNSKGACAHLAVAYRKLGQADKAREVLLELKAINDRERAGAGTKDSIRTPDRPAEGKAPPAS
jgi:tetratricopeptide (TPR) repeat protein